MIEAYADHWALITGASSGIGAEFARQLAVRGMHLILTARREERLTALAQELHTAHGTKTEIIVADLSDPQEPARLIAEVERRGRTIELLVNDAGFGHVGEIATTDVNRILNMIHVNVSALTELTYRVLPGMLTRGHGAIINVASTAGLQPVAYMGAYAASKAYVLHFSEALWAETAERGVLVLALCPGTTRTGFFDVAGAAGWLAHRPAQDPKTVVRAALKGLDNNRHVVISGWRNRLVSLLVRIAPRRRVVKESLKYFRPQPAEKDEQGGVGES